MSDPKRFFKKAKHLLDGVSWLSLDVFDTALFRKVPRPIDVFQLMEAEARGILGDRALDFVSARVAAEREARNELRGNPLGFEDISLSQIYDHFAQRFDLSATDKETLFDLEFQIEQRCVYANPLVLTLHDEARRQGKKIIFLSDMYMSAAQISSLLQAVGYRDPVVVVSSEYRATKGSGRLYHHVQQSLGIPRGDILHIGDNYRSDYLRAKLNGWKALHLEDFSMNDSSSTTDMAHILSRGMIARDRRVSRVGRSRTEETCRSIGYGIVGPIYFSFATWLCSQIVQTGRRRLHLCARDGFPLIKALEILKRQCQLDLDINYLHASRKLCVQANIRKLGPAETEFLLMATPGFTLRDFILRCDCDPVEHEARLRALGFDSLDMPITSPDFGRFIVPRYKEWLQEWIVSITSSILERQQRSRALILEYLLEQRVDSADAFVVDLGWKGSLIQAMQHILREASPKVALHSLFFGTTADARSIIAEGGSVDSYFFHLGQPSRRELLCRECLELVELLFSAPHPTIIGLQKDASGISPVYGTNEYSEQQTEQLTIIREAAWQFVEDASSLGAKALDFTANSNTTTLVEEQLQRILRQPTPTEAEVLGAFGHWHGYGDQGQLRRFAQIPQPPASATFPLWPLAQAYSSCFWKKGFLVQISTPAALFVRFYQFWRAVYVSIQSGTLWSSVKWALLKRS